jgi:hypothetical protein
MPPGTIALKKPSRSRVKQKKYARVLLLTRAHIDGRAPAARAFDRLVHAIERDLGGPGELSSVERSLVEAFVGSATPLNHLNSRMLLGEEIDVADHSAVVSALVRVASRLGLRRRSRDITPTLAEFAALHDLEAREAARNGASHELGNHQDDAEAVADAMRELDDA